MLLVIGAVALLALGRASAWPGPEDDDPGYSDNTASLSYTDTLGQGDGSSSSPIAAPGQGGAGSHYFVSASNQPVPLVGVSADNACHFNKTGTGQCNYGSYQQKIIDDTAAGLNVIRLWVNVGGLAMGSSCKFDSANYDPNDQPFTYSASNLQADGLGRWYLDSQNKNYFQRLWDVVNFAANNGVYVEVTIFSPQTANLFLGPWSTAHAYLQNGTHLAGFSDTANFVNTGSPQYQPMRTYIFNVVDWTVDWLHSFSNVYYEVANEPEWIRPSKGAPCTGWGTQSTTDPATVATWQAAIAGEIQSREAHNGVSQPIAVEPLTTTDANSFRTTPAGPYANSAAVINSHYTNLNPVVGAVDPVTGQSLKGSGLGAIHLVRAYNNQPKILGFNETKITGGTGCSTLGALQSVDDGRAEAWEFMVNQGGVYNQFGYMCSSGDYYETRRQMGVLRSFLVGPVNIGRNLKTTSPGTSSQPPTWVNPGAYPVAASRFTTYKFWAAVEPTATAATKRWLLYIHHSIDPTMVFDGYHASPSQYQEGTSQQCPSGLSSCPFSVCLGTTSGNYTAKWIDPKNAMLGGVVQVIPGSIPTPITWIGTSACTPGGAGSIPLTSPTYSFDVALLIS